MIAHRFKQSQCPLLSLLLALVALSLASCSLALPNEAQIRSASPARLQEMEAALRQRVKEQPDNPRALMLLAAALLRRGAHPEAEQAAMQADLLAPAQGPVLLLLAEINLAQERRFRALNTATQAVQFDPDLLPAYVVMARAHALLGEPARAFRALDEAIRRERRYFPAWYQRALILYETGSLKEAEAAVEEALRIQPGAREAILLRIRIAKHGGRLGRAEYLTQLAQEKFPDDRDVMLETLDTHYQRQDWQGASQVLDRLAKLGPLTPEARLAQLELLRAQGLARAFDTGLAELLAAQPRFVPALLLQARGLLESDNPKEAARVLARAADLAPGSIAAHYWRAVALYQSGETSQADTELAETGRLAPDYPPLRLLRVRRHLMENRLDIATQLLEEFLRDYPSDPEALLIKSELRVLSGDFGGAQLMLASIPPSWDARLLSIAKARLAYLRGDYRGVLDLTSPLVAQPRASWRVVYLHAEALARTGKHAEAIALLQPYQRLPETDGRVQRLIGDIHQLAGDRKAAERAYQEGLTLFPRRAILIEGLSRVAMDGENWALVRDVLESSSEPSSEFSAVFLERLAIAYQRLGNGEAARRTRQRYLALADPVLRELQRPSDQGILFNMTLQHVETTVRAGVAAPPASPAAAPPR